MPAPCRINSERGIQKDREGKIRDLPLGNVSEYEKKKKTEKS
jgi:hypothetical protein